MYLLSTVMVMFGNSLSRKTKCARNFWNNHKKNAMPAEGLEKRTLISLSLLAISKIGNKELEVSEIQPFTSRLKNNHNITYRNAIAQPFARS